jgi:hypothetical protein
MQRQWVCVEFGIESDPEPSDAQLEQFLADSNLYLTAGSGPIETSRSIVW